MCWIVSTATSTDLVITIPIAFSTNNYGIGITWQYNRDTNFYGTYNSRNKTQISINTATLNGHEVVLCMVGY